MGRVSLSAFYPGSDVRGLGGFGAVASQSSSPAELRARMQTMVDQLRREWLLIKAQIIAGKYTGTLDSGVSGLKTIDNVIALKEKSMGDVLGGQLTLEKWINGVEVARAEVAAYGKYVANNASVLVNLEHLKNDLKTTAADYGTHFVAAAKVAGAGLAVGTLGLIALAGVVLWKFGPVILRMYLPPPRYNGWKARRRR